MIRMLQSKCTNLPPNVLFEIFDTVVVPTATYASEIWGYKIHNSIENAQLKFCRQLLGVGSHTPNVAVLGECGQFPLFVTYYSKCVKYYLKLVSMEPGELPKSAYNMALVLCEAGKNNWVSYVKNLLFRYGFGFAFENQGVGNQKQFLCMFKQRLKDNYVQEWYSSTNETSKLKHYCQYKSSFEMEKYLSVIDIRKYKIALAKFRCSNHNLNVEVGRQQNVPLILDVVYSAQTKVKTT